MFYYFPEIYDEEILYSIIARYHYHVGNSCYLDTLKEAFSSVCPPNVETPNKLNSFCNNFWPGSSLDSDYFIRHHTLLPAYLPFLREEDQKEIIEAVKTSNEKVIIKVGAASNPVGRKKFLSYCPMCVKEDVQKYGEAYFHRVHQLQTVLVCPEHGCFLEDYKWFDGNRKSHLIRLEPEKVISVPSYPKEEELKVFKQIAQSFLFLLQNDVQCNRGLLIKKYKYLLSENNFINGKGHIRGKELREHLLEHYGEENLIKLHSSVINGDNRNWFANLMSEKRYTLHPIRHVLIILLLMDSIEDFFKLEIPDQSNEIQNPFGAGPWECPNPIANHSKEQIIAECSLSQKGKKIIGVFNCPSCGMKFSLTFNQVSGKIKRKTIEFGPEWEKKLESLIREEKIQNPYLIAKLLKCDCKVIIGHASNLGLIGLLDYGKKIVLGQKSTISLKEERREKFLSFIKELPFFTRNELKLYLGNIYIYLRDHDKEWLSQYLPREQKGFRKKVDNSASWAVKDKLYLEKIEEAYAQLIANEKPTRITKNSLSNVIGTNSWVEQLDKMPETKALVERICESKEDFLIRRINYWSQKLYLEKGRLSIGLLDQHINLYGEPLSARVKEVLENNFVKFGLYENTGCSSKLLAI